MFDQKNVVYIGVFFPIENYKLVTGKYGNGHEKPIRYMHVTLAFRPKTVNPDLFGLAVKVKVVGYGRDAENEGFKVEVESDNEEIQAMVSKLKGPAHITTSVSFDGKPVNTSKLDFKPIEPFYVSGVLGYYSAATAAPEFE